MVNTVVILPVIDNGDWQYDIISKYSEISVDISPFLLGRHFCDFLFALLHSEHIERILFEKKRICSHGSRLAPVFSD